MQRKKSKEHVFNSVIIIYELIFGKVITNEKRISATLSPIKVSECRIEAVIKNISKYVVKFIEINENYLVILYTERI